MDKDPDEILNVFAGVNAPLSPVRPRNLAETIAGFYDALKLFISERCFIGNPVCADGRFDISTHRILTQPFAVHAETEECLKRSQSLSFRPSAKSPGTVEYVDI